MIEFSGIKAIKKDVYKKTVNGFLPRAVVVPLKQDAGEKCSWLVKEGDIVREGQLLAMSQKKDGIFSSVYSPIPGKVLDFLSCTCPNGKTSEGVKINLSGSFSFLGKKKIALDYKKFSSKEIIDSLVEKGVLNTFTSNKSSILADDIKKQSKMKNPIVIVRLFDEDVSSLTDSLITKLFFDDVVRGALTVLRATASRNLIFVADKKSDFQKNNFNDDAIKTNFVFVDEKKYPQGNKNEIVKAIKKCDWFIKQCQATKIDAKDLKNALFIDASTVLEAERSFSFDMPVTDRYVYVSGDCINASGLLKVKIGTSFENLSKQCGGLVKKVDAIIVNGIVSGFSSGEMSCPITKYVKSVQFLSKNKTVNQKQTECIRCGNCERSCPHSLFPDVLFRIIKNNLQKKPENDVYVQSIQLCDNCGICNATCPARLPISQVIYGSRG